MIFICKRLSEGLEFGCIVEGKNEDDAIKNIVKNLKKKGWGIDEDEIDEIELEKFEGGFEIINPENS
ncbi:hypothetical protein [Clostridium sporogenes]|uniref:hypothetical protein n=1 Tax=Clostridium sporogenes TaxID=1509 RepID=UPI001F41798D|nr:hypothetical protein [Clostridium sporogenes]UJA30851.1 hypothetical protein L0894_12080 [Clostridium sporogenes]